MDIVKTPVYIYLGEIFGATKEVNECVDSGKGVFIRDSPLVDPAIVLYWLFLSVLFVKKKKGAAYGDFDGRMC